MSIGLDSSYTVEVGYDELCGALAARDLQALWSMQTKLMPQAPIPMTIPWLWRWDDILPLAKRAGEVVTIERGGDRRVLAFANPGLNGLPYTSTTLWGAVQFLGPRETAPAHRHTPSAIRFVMTGTGVHTTVDGDACQMEPGDLILTPNWTWHDHNNTGDAPMVWFDGLDLPLVATLESIFFENHPDENQAVVGHNLSQHAFHAPGLGVPGVRSPAAHSPLLRYAWIDTERALAALAEQTGETVVTLDYVNPVTGGPVIETLGCAMHRISTGPRSVSRRKTGSSVFVVLHGSGTTVINGQAFAWGPGDVFVAPSWAAVDHEAEATADVFEINDRPVLEKLHLFREETLAEHQAVGGTFAPGA